MDPDVSGVTVVEDCFDGGALPLFISYVKKFAKRSYKILCLVDEPNVERQLTKVVPQESLDILRLDQDPLGWDGNEEGASSGVLRTVASLEQTIQERLDDGEGRKTVLVVPALSLIWITFGHVETMRWMLRRWKSGQRDDPSATTSSQLPILTIINSRLLTDAQKEQVKFISTAWALPSKEKEANRPQATICRLRVQVSQKKGAKCSEKVSTMDVTTNFDFVTATKSEPIKPKADQANVEEPDPTAGLTFNLKLKDAEAMAKRNVQLPHLVVRDSIRKQRGEAEESMPKSAGGQVFYIPDEADDFDDEDPDADLDI